MKSYTLKEDELNILAEDIRKLLPNGGVVLLRGELGSGKTTFVKNFAEVLHVNRDDISSPTFSVMNRYGENFFHYDVYNDGTQGFLKNGLFENLEEEGYHFVEWGDEKFEKLLKDFGFCYIIVSIHVDKNRRIYKVSNA